MPQKTKQRIAYLDWLRGLACLGMFEVHCYDAWLGGSARQGHFFGLTQFSGTIPAPLFIVLTGISCALVTETMRRKGSSPNEIALRIVRRGAEIFGLGLLFRVQEYVLGLPAAPKTDLLRVDVLNLIGLSLLFLGLFCRLTLSRGVKTVLAAGIALGIACVTPLMWTSWRPRWMPWFIESYVNGVHIYNQPQPWLFPIFPWSAFAFAGLAAGLMLTSEWAVRNVSKITAILGAVGVAVVFLSQCLDSLPRVYANYDYWHTSPNFFLARLGVVLVVIWLGYVWCRWGPGTLGFSPLIELGQASLLVYWVHIEFVYGRFSILPHMSEGIAMATLGLLILTAAMVLLAMARLRWKIQGLSLIGRLRRPSSSGAEG